MNESLKNIVDELRQTSKRTKQLDHQICETILKNIEDMEKRTTDFEFDENEWSVRLIPDKDTKCGSAIVLSYKRSIVPIGLLKELDRFFRENGFFFRYVEAYHGRFTTLSFTFSCQEDE